MRATIVDVNGRPKVSVDEEYASSYVIEEGESLIDGEPPDGMPSRCRWIDGAWVSPGPRPSPTHALGPDGLTWVETETFDDKKRNAWTAVKTERAVREYSVLTVDGSSFDADAESQVKIAGAVQLAQLALMTGSPFSIQWTTSDNTVATMDANQMIAVGLALGARTSAIYARARELRVLIDAATTVEDLDAVVW